MSKVWKTAVFILLLLGLAVVLRRKLPVVTGSPSFAAARTNLFKQALNPLDLAAFYDKDSSFDAPGCWQAVPHGLQALANVPFRIEGLIQLWGEGQAGLGRSYRETVEGIPAKGKFQMLYLLHATSFTTVEGTPIAEVVFRYGDGSSATNAILYGTDSRDWWQPLSEHTPLPANSASLVVWRGDHPDLPDWVKSLRLFGMGIPNPKPDAEVKGVDFLSTKSTVTWIVAAATTGPSGAMQADPKLRQDAEAPVEEATIVVSALDKETGQPIRDARFQVTLLSGRRTKPFGLFTPDEKGEAEVDLPPERIKFLSIRTISTNYPASEISWNVEQGQKIPTNYIFRISRKAP